MSGQLSLFGGKRQRGRAPSPPKEFLLHVQLAETVRLSIMPGWSYTHLPFGEYRDPVTAGRLKRMGVTSGWPDFMFVGERAGFAFIELKRRGEKPSEEQIKRGRELASAGAAWLCTNDLEDAVGFLKDLGVVRATVSA